MAVPLNKLWVEAHFVLENVPLRILMNHALIMLPQNKLVDPFVQPGIFFEVLQNDYRLGRIDLADYFPLQFLLISE